MYLPCVSILNASLMHRFLFMSSCRIFYVPRNLTDEFCNFVVDSDSFFIYCIQFLALNCAGSVFLSRGLPSSLLSVSSSECHSFLSWSPLRHVHFAIHCGYCTVHQLLAFAECAHVEHLTHQRVSRSEIEPNAVPYGITSVLTQPSQDSPTIDPISPITWSYS